MKFPNFEMPKFESKGISEAVRAINNPEFKFIDAIKPPPSLAERLETMNRMRDMQNLMYEISIKEVQKQAYEKRLKNINVSNEIKWGIIISILIITFSIVIPFIMVAFQNCLVDDQIAVLVYLISTFILSMSAMLGYLIWFFYKEN